MRPNLSLGDTVAGLHTALGHEVEAVAEMRNLPNPAA